MSGFRHGGQDQMTVGEILDHLRRLDPNRLTRWMFGNPHSYRGYYEQVAMSILDVRQSVGDEILGVECCLGLHEGYKGGSFMMSPSTPVWVADYGSVGFPLTTGFLDLFLGDGE